MFERGRIANHILTLAEQGQFLILTSTLTLAEVHKKRHAPKLTETEDDKILTFFEHEFIKLVDVDRAVGEDANRFAREYNIPPNDAIHLACALKGGCDVLLTWDEHLLKVQRTGVRIERPQMLGQQVLELEP